VSPRRSDKPGPKNKRNSTERNGTTRATRPRNSTAPTRRRRTTARKRSTRSRARPDGARRARAHPRRSAPTRVGVAIVGERLLDTGAVVHHRRAVLRDRFTDGWPWRTSISAPSTRRRSRPRRRPANARRSTRRGRARRCAPRLRKRRARARCRDPQRAATRTSMRRRRVGSNALRDRRGGATLSDRCSFRTSCVTRRPQTQRGRSLSFWPMDNGGGGESARTPDTGRTVL